jgi:hypothetical protein
MQGLNIAHSYVSLERAGALSGVSASDLIHAGAFGQVQICVNIYARAVGFSMARIDTAVDNDLTDFDAETREEAHALNKIFCDWINRLKINVMPAGIYEVTQDDLRLFEMPEHERIELDEAYRSDDRGLWEIKFDPPVNATRSDLVMLTTEIERIGKSGGINITAVDRPLTTRERTSYLNIIGALLSQLTAGKANDTTVITQAVTDYGTKQGISQRKLQQAFAEAKRSLGAT